VTLAWYQLIVPSNDGQEKRMIILGIILLVIGFIAKIAVCGASGLSSWLSA
jgi:hypothetical protein